MSGTSRRPRITFVVAAAENGIIGQGGSLPWKLSSDLKFFRTMTIGKPVIMGRKTFQSIGKPLDGRDNIVLTRDEDFKAPAGVSVAHRVEDALDLAYRFAEDRGVNEIAVIGGAEIYALLLAKADRLYLTRVHAEPEGDASFVIDPALWQEVERKQMARSVRDQHEATFITYDRR